MQQIETSGTADPQVGASVTANLGIGDPGTADPQIGTLGTADPQIGTLGTADPQIGASVTANLGIGDPDIQGQFSPNQAVNQNGKKPTHWPSVLQLVLSAIAVLLLWGGAGGLLMIGLIPRGGFSLALGSPSTEIILLATGLAFSGMLLLPSAGFALLRLMGKSEVSQRISRRFRFLRPSIFILTFPLWLYAGHWVIENTQLDYTLLPPLYVLAVGLPIFWLLSLGKRALPAGSPQRVWGVFGSGLALSSMLIMLAEIAVLALFIILASAYLSLHPQLADEFSFLAQRLTYAPRTPEVLQRILLPYLRRPGIVFPLLLFVVVVVPLIEETLKPVGVWLLARRDLTPTDGFVIGLLSGAGYAMFENLLFAVNTANWSVTILSRTGTALMHILTASLTGFALVSAWREKRYIRLGVTYLAAIFVHGLWNGLAISTIGLQLAASEAGTSLMARVVGIAPIALGVLAVTMLAGLLGSNWMLRHHQRDFSFDHPLGHIQDSPVNL